jgi:hypothetical protein
MRMIKTDESFRHNQVLSMVIGFLLAVGLPIGLACLAGGETEQHDPQNLLQLRAECLKDDPSMFTTKCDEFAEKYSRINR